MIRRLFRYLILFPLAAIGIGVTATVIWLYLRDPLTSLPLPVGNVVANRTQPVVDHGRRLEHIVLSAGPLGDIGIIVNLPDPLPAKKLPILIVLGGVGSGEGNIRAITNAGDNAIIGYDWPIPVPIPQGRDLIRQIPDLYKRLMIIPGQVATAIGWLAIQKGADDKRISVLGFSLGSLAAPAVDNLAQQAGHPVGWTIIAYGGAPFGDLFAANPHMRPEWLRVVLGPLIDLLLHPLEPTVNLPGLKGHFLILEGRDDALIPAEARARLRDAVPNPKDVVVFGGDHMGVGADKKALLDDIIRMSRNWLIQTGAGNP